MLHNEENQKALQPVLNQFFGQQSGSQWSDSIMRLLGLAVMSEEFGQMPARHRSNTVYECTTLIRFIRFMEQTQLPDKQPE